MECKRILYNLNGHGQLLLYSYPYTTYLYGLLEDNNYDAKFHQTYQLGALKNVLHGANYTRYEYIILQLYLIHQLKSNCKNSGLATKLNCIDKLPEFTEKPTKAEVLQCLVLLVNMGHFPDTFAASKAWLHLLSNNKYNVKNGFKAGLQAEEKKLLDDCINDFNIYKIHYINALFLLRRYNNTPKYKELIRFASNILKSYINNDEAMIDLWNIYMVIRKIAYLVIDSTYAPIPFKLELSSIVSNLQYLFDVNGENGISQTLQKIDIVLQDSLYLSGNSLIASSIKTNEILDKVNTFELKGELRKISVVRKLIEPLSDRNSNLVSVFNNYSKHKFPKILWDQSNCIEINYDNIDKFKSLFPSNIYDLEIYMQNKCGKNSCYVAAAYNPSKKLLRIVYSPKRELDDIVKIKSYLKFCAEQGQFSLDLAKKNYNNTYTLENKRKVLEFCMKSIMGWSYSFSFEWEQIQNTNLDPILIENGTGKMVKLIDKYIDSAKNKINKNNLHEMIVVRDYLKTLNYRGNICCFLGATKLWGDNPTPKAEFDGIIFMPNRADDIFAVIVEAKNKPNGKTEAKRQLAERLDEFLLDSYKKNFVDVGNKGAVAEISIK